MNVYYAVKDLFIKEALSFKKINYKTMFCLSLILLLNIIYLFINGMGYLKGIPNISVRTINTMFSIISVALFLFTLKGNLYHTIEPQNKTTIKKTLLYANITFIFSYLVYYFYNHIMTMFKTPLGGDVQHISHITKIDWFNYITLIGRYVFSLFNEELILLSVFLIIFSFFKEHKVSNTVISMFGTLLFFGCLHWISWNAATIPAVMISKLPACFLFIFFKDIKPLYLAHLFNNSFVSLITVAGITNAIRMNILWIFLLPVICYLIYNTLENKLIKR